MSSLSEGVFPECIHLDQCITQVHVIVAQKLETSSSSPASWSGLMPDRAVPRFFCAVSDGPPID